MMFAGMFVSQNRKDMMFSVYDIQWGIHAGQGVN